MAMSQETMHILEQAVEGYNNADTSNTFFGLQDIHPGGQGHTLMSKTTYIEFDPSKSRAKLPSLFARAYGPFLRSYVILQDPKRNQIQISVEKKGDKVYLTRGWAQLKDFYGVVFGGWVTVVYVNPFLFHMKLRRLTGNEVAYPEGDPPFRLMMLRPGVSDPATGPDRDFVPPTLFTHSFEKTLTACDIESGVLSLPRDGFCGQALPAEDGDLKLVDWMGYTWKCRMQMQDNSCIIYGEWRQICKARGFIKGAVVKFGVTEPVRNEVIHFKLVPLMGVRTTLVAPAVAGGYKAFYQIDHYYML